jgi:RNA polymerase sigma-70 factor, ECF subfamily
VAVGDITQLLRAWQGGDRAAFDQLMPQIYDELRRIAARALHRERSDHTLRATDLVSEAYLRLAAAQGAEPNDRLHFFAIAARCMRQILVDHARKKTAVKRLAPAEQDAPAADVIEIDEAIAGLAKHDERKAKVVELYYFGGMTHDEVAALLDVSRNTVVRDLQFAAAWIRRELAAP